MSQFILQLLGILRFEAFNGKDLVNSVQLQFIVGVMVVGAYIGKCDCGEVNVARPTFTKGFLHFLLDLYLDEVEEVVFQFASLLLGNLKVVFVFPEKKLALMGKIRTYPARGTLLAHFL